MKHNQLIQDYYLELQVHRDYIQTVALWSAILGGLLVASAAFERYLGGDLIHLTFWWGVAFVVIGLSQRGRLRRQRELIERVAEQTGVRPDLG